MKKITLFLLILFSISSIKAQLSGYSYVKPITVSNTSTTSAVDYQLQITINTQSLIAGSQMLASGNDIRFGKNCTGTDVYNYWIESGINTANTIIWVKMDSLAANSTKTFFMFYGNALAPASSGIPGVFVGPNSSTDSISGGASGGVGSSQRGFRFSSDEDLLVTAFGKDEPTGTMRYITLFDNATQTVVAQTQVAGAAGQYTYTNLANPFWITQNTQYLLEMYQAASDGYYYGSSSQIGQHLTYYDMRYCNSCTQNTFPTSSLNNFHYGYPDLWYWTKTTVSPAPSYTIELGPAASIAQSQFSVCPFDIVTFTASSSMPSVIFTWLPGATTDNTLSVSSSATAIYTLQATSAGCSYSAEANATVVINPAPVITITGNTPLCDSGTDVLSASGASTYTWNGSTTSNSLSVSISSTTSYSIEATSALGCTNTAVTTVTVSSSPTVTLSATNPTLCSGNSTSLIASGAATYSWSTGDLTANIYATPAATSDYSVTGTSLAGCTNTAVISLTVNTTPTVSIAVTNATICSGNSTSLTASGASTYSWNTLASTAGISVSPSITTNYTVVGTSPEGCSDAVVATVTVEPLPTLVISPANPAVCLGNSITLTATGANIYSWTPSSNNASIIISPASTSSYTLVGTSSAGCTSSAITTVTVSPNPTITISGPNVVICSGTSATLTASGALNYIWTGGATTNTITLTPTVTVSYSVSGTDSNSCIGTAVKTVSVSDCTGIAIIKNTEATPKVYPNPNNGKFTLELNEGGDVVIVNTLGQSVYSHKHESGKSQINIEPLKNGVYYLQVTENQHAYNVKLIKE